MNNNRNSNDWKPGIALLTGIDDKYVCEALSSSKKRSAAKWLYVAAAVLIVLVAVFAAVHFLKPRADEKYAIVDIELSDPSAMPVLPTEPLSTVPAVSPIPSETTAPTEDADPIISVQPTQTVIETDRPSQTDSVPPTIAPTPSPGATTTPKPYSPTPPPNSGPADNFMFFSEEDFIAAVTSGNENYEAISWITRYYIAEHVPSWAEFTSILATTKYVRISYKDAREPDEIYTRFDFYWRADLNADNVEDAANDYAHSGGNVREVTKYGKYYIVPGPGYTSNWWRVYWAQDGEVFMVQFRDNSCFELVDIVCNAKLIPIN